MSFHDYKLIKKVHNNPRTLKYFHPKISEIINFDTPALTVFSDFHTSQPQIIKSNTLATEALQKMQEQKIHALLVVGKNNDIVGLINSKDIQGTQRLQISQKENINVRDLTTYMLMKKISEIDLFDYKLMKNALVGHIIRIVYETQSDHIIVIELDKQKKCFIRGIFSANFIFKRLGKNITPNFISSNLADISKII